MADDRVVSETVAKLFLNTCQLRQQLNEDSVQGMDLCVGVATRRQRNNEANYIPLTT